MTYHTFTVPSFTVPEERHERSYTIVFQKLFKLETKSVIVNNFPRNNQTIRYKK